MSQRERRRTAAGAFITSKAVPVHATRPSRRNQKEGSRLALLMAGTRRMDPRYPHCPHRIRCYSAQTTRARALQTLGIQRGLRRTPAHFGSYKPRRW